MFSNSGMQEKLESFEGRKHYLSSKIKRKHTKKKYHLWGVVAPMSNNLICSLSPYSTTSCRQQFCSGLFRDTSMLHCTITD